MDDIEISLNGMRYRAQSPMSVRVGAGTKSVEVMVIGPGSGGGIAAPTQAALVDSSCFDRLLWALRRDWAKRDRQTAQRMARRAMRRAR